MFAMLTTFTAWINTLAHATTALSNDELSHFEELIVHSMPQVTPGRTWEWADLPHERRYDRFGLAVATAVYGQDRVRSDFATIKATGLATNSRRLDQVLCLGPLHHLEGLREELAEFCQPYREHLLSIWQKKRASTAPGPTRFITRLDSLWDNQSG